MIGVDEVAISQTESRLRILFKALLVLVIIVSCCDLTFFLLAIHSANSAKDKPKPSTVNSSNQGKIPKQEDEIRRHPSQELAFGPQLTENGSCSDITQKDIALLKKSLCTTEQRCELERFQAKDAALDRFQKQHDISDRIAESAIKEWVVNRGNNSDWDWNLVEVELICLRNKDMGIPYQYLPESEKKDRQTNTTR